MYIKFNNENNNEDNDIKYSFLVAAISGMIIIGLLLFVVIRNVT